MNEKFDCWRSDSAALGAHGLCIASMWIDGDVSRLYGTVVLHVPENRVTIKDLIRVRDSGGRSICNSLVFSDS